MKKLLLLSLTFLCLQNTFAQSEDEMKAWMDYSTPGDIHKMLANRAGTWSEEITMWPAPGAEPMTYEATMVREAEMDGRYMRETHTGDFMGMPFHGLGYVGYDNSRKVFCSNWIDNMGTGMMYGEGPYNPETKTVELKGKTTDPMTGKAINYREVFTLIDDKHEKLEMYMEHEGKEFKSMEINLTKQ